MLSLIHLIMILRNVEENRAMNHEEHVGDVLVEFYQLEFNNFMVGCGCS